MTTWAPRASLKWSVVFEESAAPSSAEILLETVPTSPSVFTRRLSLSFPPIAGIASSSNLFAPEGLMHADLSHHVDAAAPKLVEFFERYLL
jgi:hypothetical protein